MTKYYCLAQTKGLTARNRQLNKAAQYYHSNDAISAISFHSAFSKESSPENFRWARISVHEARACQGYIVLYSIVRVRWGGAVLKASTISKVRWCRALINCVILNKLVTPLASNAGIYRQHTKRQLCVQNNNKFLQHSCKNFKTTYKN